MMGKDLTDLCLKLTGTNNSTIFLDDIPAEASEYMGQLHDLLSVQIYFFSILTYSRKLSASMLSVSRNIIYHVLI